MVVVTTKPQQPAPHCGIVQLILGCKLPTQPAAHHDSGRDRDSFSGQRDKPQNHGLTLHAAAGHKRKPENTGYSYMQAVGHKHKPKGQSLQLHAAAGQKRKPKHKAYSYMQQQNPCTFKIIPKQEGRPQDSPSELG